MSDQETARPAIPTSERLQVARDKAVASLSALEEAQRATWVPSAEMLAQRAEVARDLWVCHDARCPQNGLFDECETCDRLYGDMLMARKAYDEAGL